MASRQPRPIGSTRPSRRAPPSSIAASTMPAKISSKGWARTITPTTARTRPIQTLARFSSCADDRIAKLDRPGLLDCARGARASLMAALPAAPRGGPRSAWSEVPARPPRRAVNQLIGFQ